MELETYSELEVSKKQEKTLTLTKETSTAQVILLNKNYFPVYPKGNIKKFFANHNPTGEKGLEISSNNKKYWRAAKLIW